MAIRQPIVAVLGHVDHGKTSILDYLRGGSRVMAREAGGITQHIGATEMPAETVAEMVGPLLGSRELKIPGLLFIDTPGHQSFTTLRARGGTLADIAILVIDVREGLMPQTIESLTILRQARTPFLIAANKVDRIPFWKSRKNTPFALSLVKQAESAQKRLDEDLYKLVGELHREGFTADRYDRIDDFTQAIGIVPTSAKEGEGLQDLLLVLVGLAEKFLEEQLEKKVEVAAEATIIEVKEEKGLGHTLDVILYQGVMKKGQKLLVAGMNGIIETHVKGLLKPKALDEMRDPREKFKQVNRVLPASGVKILAPNISDAMAGTTIYALDDELDLEEIREQLEQSLEISVRTQEKGIFIRADTLGSLEALAKELSDHEIPIRSAKLGNISRRDVIDANTAPDVMDHVVLGFNVKLLPDAEEEIHEETFISISDIIYRLIEAYDEWKEKRTLDLDKERRSEFYFPGKVLFLSDHTFRVSKPAVFGVRVLGGRVRVGQKMMRADGKSLGKIKSIRSGQESLKEARLGQELALAVEGIQIGRHLKEEDTLYVELRPDDVRSLHKIDLSADEADVLEETLKVKRKDNPFWGR